MEEFSDADLIGAITAAGLPAPTMPLKLDGTYNRWGVNGRKPCWLIGHTLTSGHVAATFGDWCTGSRVTFRSWENGQTADPNEAQRFIDECARRQKTADEAAYRAKAATARREVEIWEFLPETGESAYLERKQVQAFGIRYGADYHGNFIAVPMRNVSGTLRAFQRIYHDGRKQFPKHSEKKGCYHLIGQLDPSSEIYLCEGYATGATVHQATGKPVAVCFDAGNLNAVADALKTIHPDLQLIVAADNDQWKADELDGRGKKKGNAGLKAAFTIARVHPGTRVAIPSFDNLDISDKPTDFNDLAALAGLENVGRQLNQAREPKPNAGTEARHETAPNNDDSRPTIDAIPGNLHIVVRKAEQALLKADVDIFQRVGVLVRPTTLPTEVQVSGATIAAGTLVIEPVSKAWLAERMNEVATWCKYNERKGAMVRTDCPAKYAEHYLAKKGEWNARILTGIVEAPTLRRDGSLLTTPGYDPISGLYLNYTGQAVNVPDHPTRDDALKALDVLKAPFEEFAFVSDVDRAVILSGLLTAIARRSLRTAPYHACDAPVPGSGKGLLVDVCAMVATGRVATSTTIGTDETEAEKRLGALLMRGVPFINLDNAARPVEGDFICSLATQETVDVRILGQSATATIPTSTATVFITGNNLVLKGDMTRRVLLCRIDPRCERPDSLQFKRNLHEFVPANRHRLLSAALTVLRAYICAGSPACGKAPYGSFEQWDRLIRGALLWLDQPDPLESRDRIDSNDPAAMGIRSLLETWFEVFNTRAVTIHEVVAEATPSTPTGQYSHAKGEDLRHALIEVAGNRDGISINPRALSHYLRRNRDKVAGKYRLEQSGTYGKYALWKLGINGIRGISSAHPENFRASVHAHHEDSERIGKKEDSAKNVGMAETNAANASNARNAADNSADDILADFGTSDSPPDPGEGYLDSLVADSGFRPVVSAKNIRGSATNPAVPTADEDWLDFVEVPGDTAPPPAHKPKPACGNCRRHAKHASTCKALGVYADPLLEPVCGGRHFEPAEVRS